jgi:hypothetical protein
MSAAGSCQDVADGARPDHREHDYLDDGMGPVGRRDFPGWLLPWWGLGGPGFHGLPQGLCDGGLEFVTISLDDAKRQGRARRGALS